MAPVKEERGLLALLYAFTEPVSEQEAEEWGVPHPTCVLSHVIIPQQQPVIPDGEEGLVCHAAAAMMCPPPFAQEINQAESVQSRQPGWVAEFLPVKGVHELVGIVEITSVAKHTDGGRPSMAAFAWLQALGLPLTSPVVTVFKPKQGAASKSPALWCCSAWGWAQVAQVVELT
jgi:hypothetical protein